MNGAPPQAPALAVPQRRNAAAVVLAALGLAAVAAVVYAVDPAEGRFPPLCPFHAITGLHCPGCGSTRALHQLLHGHLAAAFGLNPLMVLALPFLAWGLLSSAREGLTGRRLPGVFIPAFYLRAFLVLLLLFTVLRNLPIEPFTYLAP